MSTPSRKKKAGQAKRAAWLTLLFVNLVAPIILLVLDKSLPDGLFGRRAKTDAEEVRVSLRQVSQSALTRVKPFVAPRENSTHVPKSTGPENENQSVRFSNKGDGNAIDNTQETEENQSADFSNEGNNNTIKNVQRSK